MSIFPETKTILEWKLRFRDLIVEINGSNNALIDDTPRPIHLSNGRVVSSKEKGEKRRVARIADITRGVQSRLTMRRPIINRAKVAWKTRGDPSFAFNRYPDKFQAERIEKPSWYVCSSPGGREMFGCLMCHCVPGRRF